MAERKGQYDHEVPLRCADCGEPIMADYDGELWHTKDYEAFEARVLATVRSQPEPRPEPRFSELKKAYLETGKLPVDQDEQRRYGA